MCIQDDIPDYSEMEHKSHNWMHSLYGDIEEEVPPDIPNPLGKLIQTSSFFNANHYHNFVTGHAITTTLHIVN